MSLDHDMQVVQARPGERAQVHLTLTNDSGEDRRYSMELVGLDDGGAANRSLGTVAVPARSRTTSTIEVPIPTELGIGNHAAAIRLADMSGLGTQRLVPIVVAVASVDDVELVARPAPVRGRRRVRFRLDITNNEPNLLDIELDGDAPDVRVRFDHRSFQLAPGQRVSTQVKLRGPRRWRGEPVQHGVLVSARGPASETTTIVPYLQRALIGVTLRTAVALVTILALVAGAVVVALRLDWGGDDATNDAAFVDENGDGVPDQPVDLDQDGRPDQLVDADGDGLYDALLDPARRPVEGTGGGVVQPGSPVDADGDGYFDPAVDDSGVAIPGTGGSSVRLTGSGQDLDGDGRFDPQVDENGLEVPGTGGAPVNPSSDFALSADGIGEPVGGAASGGVAEDLPRVGYSGTVSADGTTIDGIRVRVAPLTLGESQNRAAAAAAGAARPSGFAGGPGGLARSTSSDVGAGTKIWSARFAELPHELNPTRWTEPIAQLDDTTDGAQAFPKDAPIATDGVWRITGLPRRQSYELLFSKEGFDSQSFVVTPPEEGAPEAIDIVLTPGRGSLAGTVTGAGGRPLGGVSITVTDGTLVFETTSATQPDQSAGIDVGDWRLDRLSTPATYTVVAETDGFGREVEQVALGEGASDLNVDLGLTIGVGSLTGFVRAPSNRLRGGVTVTASNGEITRTTTSRTDPNGQVGRYDIPQLPIPGTYTVSASFDGFITSSSRVTLTTAAPNQARDFTLVSTTQQVSGRVVSALSQQGLNAAVVTLQRGELTFRTQTGPDPIDGSFSLANLPAGDYVVTVEADRHDTVTLFETIEEGVVEPPVTIALQPNDGVVDLEGAQIAFFMSDVDGQEIAPITVERETSGTLFDRERVDTFGGTIDVEPGTHVLTVRAGTFTDFGPFRVSVGPGQTIEVRETMQRNADAQGVVVDFFAPDPADPRARLDQYDLELRKVLNDGSLGVAVKTQISVEQDPTDPDYRVWKSFPERTLSPGDWQVSFDEAFPGYEVREQNLDNTVARTMRFNIPVDVEDIITVPVPPLPPIKAVPYPTISGRIVVPRLIGTTTAFVPINAADLQVRLRCSDGSADHTLSQDDGTPAADPEILDLDGTPGFDAYSVKKEVVDRENLDCAGPSADADPPRNADLEIVVSAGGFQTKTIAFSDVRVGDGSPGSSRTDRVFNIALNRAPDDFGGNLYWTDYGTTPNTQVLLDGVDIDAGQPIVDFLPSDDPVQVGTDPAIQRRPVLTSTTQLGGNWVFTETDPPEPPLTEQIFGVTRYVIDVDDFGPSSMDLRIDERGRSIVASQGMNLDTSDLTALDVELTPPDPATIAGEITILTNDPSGPDHRVPITTTRPQLPNGPGAGTVVGPTRADGSFEIVDASPGTWNVNFGAVDNHEFREPDLPTDRPNADATVPPAAPPAKCGSTSLQCVTARLDPGDNGASGDPTDDALSGFNTNLVELGTVDIVLVEVDDAGNEVRTIDDQDGIVLTLTGPSATYPAPPPARFDAGDGIGPDGNIYRLDGLLVDVSRPLDVAVAYRAALQVPGFDARSARIVNESAPWNPAQNLPTFQGSDRQIDLGTLNVEAGTKLVLEVQVQPYGTLTGRIDGKVSDAPATPLQAADLDTADITATLRFDVFGNPVVDPPPAGISRDNTAGTFAIKGPPGFYEISVSHPRFSETLLSKPTATNPPIPIGGISLENSGFFLLQNKVTRTLNGPYVLDVRRGTLDLTAVTVLTGVANQPSDVATATFLLASDLLSGTGNVRFAALGDDGRVVLDDLYPGRYTLEVRAYPVGSPALVEPIPRPGAAGQNRFPVIIEIEIRDEFLRVPPVPPSLTTVIAPLPVRGGSITGTVRAVNTNGDAVALPVDGAGRVLSETGLATMISDFDTPQVRVDGELVDNTPADPTTGITLVPGSNPPTYTYTLSDVANGRHDVMAPEDIPGYTLLTTNAPTTIVADEATVTGPTFEYEVAPSVVTFALTSALANQIYPDLVVTLTTPLPDQVATTYTLTDSDGVPLTVAGASFDPATNTVTIDSVPPRIGSFRLSVDSALHLPTTLPDSDPATDDDIIIEPDVDGNGTRLADVQMVGERTRLEVRVQLNDGGTTPLRTLTAPGFVRLTPVSPPGAVIDLPASAQDADGVFTFVTAAGLDPPAGAYTIEAQHPGTPSSRGYVSSPQITLNLVSGTRNTPAPIVLARLARYSVSITNANQTTNPRPRLVDVKDPTNPAKVYPPIAGTSYDFNVPAGEYRLDFEADNYPNLTVSPSNIRLAVGEDAGPRPPIVLPRVVRVLVSGSLTARVRVDPLPTGGTDAVTQQSSTTPLIFTFRSDATSGAIPTTGGLKITASTGTQGQPGYKVNDVTVAEALGTSVELDLLQRPEATVFGRLDFNDGSRVTSVPAGTTIRAVPRTPNSLDPDDTMPASITAVFLFGDGDTTFDYELRGLTTTALNRSLTWDISMATAPGLGDLTTPANGLRVTMNPIDVNNPTLARRNKNLEITPRTVPLIVQLTPAAGQALTGARIDIGTAFGTLPNATSSTITVNVPENASGTNLVWRLSGVSEQVLALTDTERTLPPFTTRTAVNRGPYQLLSTLIDVELLKADGAPVTGGTLVLCPGFDAADACVDAVNPASGPTAGVWRFTRQEEGTYVVLATTTPEGTVGKAENQTIVVAANGVATPRTKTITVTPLPLPTPPPP